MSLSKKSKSMVTTKTSHFAFFALFIMFLTNSLSFMTYSWNQKDFLYSQLLVLWNICSLLIICTEHSCYYKHSLLISLRQIHHPPIPTGARPRGRLYFCLKCKCLNLYFLYLLLPLFKFNIFKIIFISSISSSQSNM